MTLAYKGWVALAAAPKALGSAHRPSRPWPMLLAAMSLAAFLLGQPALVRSQDTRAPFPRYEAAFERFAGGDIAGALQDLDRIANELARSRPQEASRALTLSAFIRTEISFGFIDRAKAREEWRRALALDEGNAMARAHFAIFRRKGRFGPESWESVLPDLETAMKDGSAVAALMLGELAIHREGLSSERALRAFERAEELGNYEAKWALMLLALHRGNSVNEEAARRLAASLEDGSRFALAAQFRVDQIRQWNGGPHARLTWAFLSMFAAGRRDLENFGLVSLPSAPPDRERSIARSLAEQWVRDRLSSNSGRWSEFAASCGPLGTDHPIYARCTVEAINIGDQCSGFSLWSPDKEFQRSRAFSICMSADVDLMLVHFEINPHHPLFAR